MNKYISKAAFSHTNNVWQHRTNRKVFSSSCTNRSAGTSNCVDWGCGRVRHIVLENIVERENIWIRFVRFFFFKSSNIISSKYWAKSKLDDSCYFNLWIKKKTTTYSTGVFNIRCHRCKFPGTTRNIGVRVILFRRSCHSLLICIWLRSEYGEFQRKLFEKWTPIEKVASCHCKFLSSIIAFLGFTLLLNVCGVILWCVWALDTKTKAKRKQPDKVVARTNMTQV